LHILEKTPEKKPPGRGAGRLRLQSIIAQPFFAAAFLAKKWL
jgi:hypothetical protein